MYIDIDTNQQVLAGLFSVSYGEIRNLGLVNANITVKGQQGEKEGGTSVGGLAGISYNNIYNSYVTGNINVTGNTWVNVGGICGVIRDGDIEKSYNFATIEGENIAETQQLSVGINCGGITGGVQENDNATIERCFNRGDINVDGNNAQISIGGILGGNNQSYNLIIKNCYNNATIQGNTLTNWSNSIGGIIGTSQKAQTNNLLNCYNVGDIIGTKNGNETKGDPFFIGGIIGNQSDNTVVSNVFNRGTITSKNYYENFRVGGITGKTGAAGTSKINNAYNTGKIEADELSNSQVGSIVGSDLVTLKNCFYLQGTYDVGVAGNETFKGVTELQNISDFPSVLEVVNGEEAFKEDTNNINNGYPILSWE